MTAPESGPLLLEPRLHYDSAFIGWAHRPGDPGPVAIYDYDLCVKAARYWLGITEAEARAWVDRETLGAWFGPTTPLVLHRGRVEDLEAYLAS